MYNVLNANYLKMYYLNIVTQLLQAKYTMYVCKHMKVIKKIMKFVITEQFNDGKGKN